MTDEVPFVGGTDSGMAAVLAHWKRAHWNRAQYTYYVQPPSGALSFETAPPTVEVTPENPVVTNAEVVIQAAITVEGDRTDEGLLVEAVTVPWRALVRELDRDPDLLSRFDWRKLEELIAAAYDANEFDVTLTPRSRDGGKDIIATKAGIEIRIIDQVKRYRVGHVVTADEVRALVGVLTLDPNVSKGVVTTTSTFAPGIADDPQLGRLMPYRLDLRDGAKLNAWLGEIARIKPM
jgi:restriction system protein